MRVFVCLLLFLGVGNLQAGALEEYVQRPDPAYHWSLRARMDGLFVHAWFIDLESQQWLDTDRVDRPFWTHELRIVQPRPWLCGHIDQPHTAVLFVSGGDNRGNPPDSVNLEAAVVEADFGGWWPGSRQTYTTDVFVAPETMPFTGNPCAPDIDWRR